MKLTKTADFALRLLIFLAKQPGQHTMSQLSRDLAIPYHNLTKLIQRLARAGMIHTQKGKQGGVKLAIDTDSVSLKDIVELIEGPMQLSECQGNEAACILSSDCKLKVQFSILSNQMNELMDNVKIKALI